MQFQFNKLWRLGLFFNLLWLAAGCSPRLKVYKINKAPKNRYNITQDGVGNPKDIPDLSMVKDPVPQNEPKSLYGNPKKYTVFNKTYKVLSSSRGYNESGEASWYGTKFHGFRTSSGETYDMYKMTAAHKTLPLPTYAKVINLKNNRSIIVKINDRGPFHGKRILDLSYVAASKLGILNDGIARVKVIALNSMKKKNDDRVKNPSLPPPIIDFKNLPNPDKIKFQLGAFKVHANAAALATKLEDLLIKSNNPKCKNYKISILPSVLQKSDKKDILYKVVVIPARGSLDLKFLNETLARLAVRKSEIKIEG